MAKKKKKMPGLNTSSTADISFMLLIFFLVTTSMDTDMGLARRLPNPPDPNQEESTVDVKDRNLLNVRINSEGYLCIYHNLTGETEYIDIADLRQRAKDFIDNPQNLSSLPEKHAKEIPMLGTCYITTDHVISVQTDRGTPYNIYFQVQNELVAAYNELRDELSKSKFGKEYSSLNEDQMKAVREYYPQKISEAEPKNYGGNK